MGLRHQVYVNLFNQESMKSDIVKHMIAVHIQYCDGYDALQLLCNLISFHKLNKGRALSYNSQYMECNLFYSDGERVTIAEKSLMSLYTTCPVTGFSSNATPLDKEFILNPDIAVDNQSGITIIDLSKANMVRYCFMRLTYSEVALERFEILQPISAYEYIQALSYLEEDKSYQRHPVWCEQHKQQLLDETVDLELLTLEKCKLLFPKLYQYNN